MTEVSYISSSHRQSSSVAIVPVVMSLVKYQLVLLARE